MMQCSSPAAGTCQRVLAVFISGGAAANRIGVLLTRAVGGATSSMVDNVVVLLAKVASTARLWGWSRIVGGPVLLRGVPGLRWAKVMGSGHEGGFGLRPSPAHQGVFAVFDSGAAALAFAEHSECVARYRAQCDELCVLRLTPFSSRGSWSGRALRADSASTVAAGLPMAALTRASIRPLAAARFWRKAPASQTSLGSADGCWLAAGLGEAPLFRQATLSMWQNVAAMNAYARSGAHLQAIQAATAERHFSESMFVRFAPLSVQGTWQGSEHAWTAP